MNPDLGLSQGTKEGNGPHKAQGLIRPMLGPGKSPVCGPQLAAPGAGGLLPGAGSRVGGLRKEG